MARGAEQEQEQKAEQETGQKLGQETGQVAGELIETLWARAHREYVVSGRWKCPEHPNGKNKGAHHWLAMNGDWVCIFCNHVKPHDEDECVPNWVLERTLKMQRKVKQDALYVAEGVLGVLR